MNESYVTVSGNVVGDPVVRTTRASVPFVTFRVASTVRRVDGKTGEYIDGGTTTSMSRPSGRWGSTSPARCTRVTR